MKIAVFSCAGLGDALITLILSHNLSLEGHDVVTFHPFMAEMQGWFPHLPIRPFPPDLAAFDRFFIFYEKSRWMGAVLEEALQNHRAQTTVLNPIATPNHDYPYWEEGRFAGGQPFVDNLVVFCKDTLKMSRPVKQNGMVIPHDLTPRKYPKRIAIHPTSSRPGKNWPKSKFVQLSRELTKRGYEPVFVVSSKERVEWPEAPLFPSLDAMARFVCESGYMIGNDSGIGHLASCLGLPTVSIFKNGRSADFWRPAFREGEICLPKGWLPNIKWMRWRDRYWYWNLPVKRVVETFERLHDCSSQ